MSTGARRPQPPPDKRDDANPSADQTLPTSAGLPPTVARPTAPAAMPSDSPHAPSTTPHHPADPATGTGTLQTGGASSGWS